MCCCDRDTRAAGRLGLEIHSDQVGRHAQCASSCCAALCCAVWSHRCLQIIWEQLKWLPTTIIFFNSVLFHMTEVCAIYFLGLPVVWGATAKVRFQGKPPEPPGWRLEWPTPAIRSPQGF